MLSEFILYCEEVGTSRLTRFSIMKVEKMEILAHEFDLIKLLSEVSWVFQSMNDGESLTFKIISPTAKVQRVRGDEFKLRQILVNLIGNIINLTATTQVTLQVTALDQNKYRFEVADNGVSENQVRQQRNPYNQGKNSPKICEPYLDLEVVKGLVSLIGGGLELTSQTGTSFFFTITLPSVQQKLQIPFGGAANPSFSGIKALVVDDIKNNRYLLTEILKMFGVEVATAENGEEAINKVRIFHPDIVFMDIYMPVMNGHVAAKALRKEFSKENLKIVAVTASAYEHDKSRAFDEGCDDYIVKPYVVMQIVETMRRMFAKQDQ